jgi:nitrogen fixation/metabolism regulation signal transduction histidine kinase
VKVVTAVATGDLKPKLTVNAKGEVAALAETINNMTGDAGDLRRSGDDGCRGKSAWKDASAARPTCRAPPVPGRT